MTTELTLEERIARGEEAKRLLEGEVMSEAFEMATQGFVREWMAAKKPEQREEAWAKVWALDQVRSALRAILTDGEYAVEERKQGGPLSRIRSRLAGRD